MAARVHRAASAVEQLQKGYMHAALANVSEGVLITDALLERPGPRIVYVNAAFSRITGYAEEEVLGKTPRLLQGAETDSTEMARLRRELATSHHFHGHAINYRKDGQAFTMDWRIIPVRDGEGCVTHYVAIQRDTTGERRAEESSRQAVRLESVGRITGEIAHNFANLLVGILGFAEVLRGELGGSDPAGKIALRIVETAERAQLLTRQLLSFSSGQEEESGNIDLREAISQIEALLLRLIGVRITTRITKDGQRHLVRATRSQVEQIVINLVTNARDAMPGGGEIKIHTQPKRLEEHQTGPHGAVPGNYIELTVSDTGVGMDEKTMARIFDPFFTTKKDGEGTGLGLANVVRHVRNLNGLITVESQPRQGSHFRVYLPAALGQPASRVGGV